ncbi:hypothetical protein [Clostridium sp.]|uniref:hypothetical protein n=1 Tax=Clostridium sp. TaxID=1506 RepID=UPI0039910511
MLKEYYFQGKYKNKESEILDKLSKTVIVFAETENYDNYNYLDNDEKELIKKNLYKKANRKEGTISKVIEKLKKLGAVENKELLNYIKYMLLVLEFRINNNINKNKESKLSISEIFNEETMLDIFLGEEYE